MVRALPLLFAAAGAALLGGCARTQPVITAEQNRSLYSVHQPVVQRTDYVLDVDAGGGALTAAEADRVRAWFDSLELRYGDRVSLDESGGYVDPAAREAIADVAGGYGLLLSEGAPVTAGTVAPGAVRLVVSRTAASVPSCPNWASAEHLGAPISTDPNFGCAINSNLAAMIADPSDLVRGQPGSAATDAEAAAKAVRDYRTRALSGAAGNVKAESVGQ